MEIARGGGLHLPKSDRFYITARYYDVTNKYFTDISNINRLRSNKS